jgi:hypothetical protein
MSVGQRWRERIEAARTRREEQALQAYLSTLDTILEHTEEERIVHPAPTEHRLRDLAIERLIGRGRLRVYLGDFCDTLIIEPV